MSTRFIVRAPDRSGQGHDAVWTPGRRWPGGREIEVEVLDQDDCPVVEERIRPDSEEKRTFVHPTQIGRLAWARIKSDTLLTVRPVGDVPSEAVTLQENLNITKAKLAEATELAESNEARAGIAEREVVKLTKQLKASAEQLSDAEEKIAKLTQERDELAAQVEQLTAPAATVEGEQPKADESTATTAQAKPVKGKRG